MVVTSINSGDKLNSDFTTDEVIIALSSMQNIKSYGLMGYLVSSTRLCGPDS